MTGIVPRAGTCLRVAHTVSVVLHPFAVFAALALLGARRLDPGSMPRTALGITVAIVLLSGFIWQRRYRGHWETVDASRRQERPLLYALALVIAVGYWLWMGGRASPASSGVLAAVAMLCVASVANRWVKLSLHMAGLAFAAIALLALVPPAGIVALVLMPILGWSRWRMARHGWHEVVGGGALGVAAGLVLQQAG